MNAILMKRKQKIGTEDKAYHQPHQFSDCCLEREDFILIWMIYRKVFAHSLGYRIFMKSIDLRVRILPCQKGCAVVFGLRNVQVKCQIVLVILVSEHFNLFGI
jgi:hypothetical protein